MGKSNNTHNNKSGGSRHNVGGIGNKIKRKQVYQVLKINKKKLKKERKLHREREAQALGAAAPPKQVPKTLDALRKYGTPLVKPDDEEVMGDEADDEFAAYFDGGKAPKIMITTKPKPSSQIFHFIKDVMGMIPNSFYYERRDFNLKQITQWAANKKFTHLMVLGEKSKKVHSMIISHLPDGPTAMFKISNIQLSKDVHNHGSSITSKPEIILNSFSTRLGHRVGRFLGSLYKHEPNFKAREVVTFHNQRDFLFVRHHRYVFDSAKVRNIHHMSLLLHG
jgi:ribosome production factor 1